jgi:hypothetical protein
MARLRDDGGRRRSGMGGGDEETMPILLMRILLGQKIKKIHTVDLAGTNGQ